MNPKVPKDSDDEHEPTATCKIRKQAKRQSRSRQEFALMHGFSSTNVGKNRLTVSQEILFNSKLVINNITAQTRSSRHWRFSER